MTCNMRMSPSVYRPGRARDHRSAAARRKHLHEFALGRISFQPVRPQHEQAVAAHGLSGRKRRSHPRLPYGPGIERA